MRLTGKNPDQPGLRRDAENLLSEIRQEEAALRALEAETIGMSDDSQINDTRAALQGIETAMYRILSQTVSDARVG